MKNRGSRIVDIGSWAAAGVLALSSNVFAKPTQEEVFKSISNNVGESTDTGKVLGVVLVASAVTVGAIALSQRKREKAKRALNSPRKLLKEVLRQMDVPGREMRKYRAAAEEKGLSSPLVAMICPSVIGRRES